VFVMLAWFQQELPSLLSTYGYTAIAVLIFLESVGLPVPGSTVLLVAAIYAGATNSMSIAGVLVASSTGAVVGDNLAYWLGRTAGYSLTARFGHYLGLTESRVKLGRYLFRRFGGWVVVLGRFVPLMRVLVTLLAGINHMGWPRFLLLNVAGVTAWAVVFGYGAYVLGVQAHRLVGPVGLAAGALGIVGLAVGVMLLTRHERRLIAQAEVAFPEPFIEEQQPRSGEP
jgi:membrane protein DedA with SNARE-associated domain